MKNARSEFNFPKKMTSSTSLMPGMFNDDLFFTFKADDVHTSDAKEIEAMFAELDVHVAKYKKELKVAVSPKK
jgi:hypothetical protein